jgi:hypothetical protein
MFDRERDLRSSSPRGVQLAGWAARAKAERRPEGPEPRLAAYARHIIIATGFIWLFFVLAPAYYLFRYLHRTDDVQWNNPYLIAVLAVGSAVAFLLGLALAKRTFHADRAQWWRTHGRCAGCGYDLSATPDRCPECGRSVTKTF